MSDDLLPCPFCGGTRLGKTTHGLPMKPAVICRDCYSSAVSVDAWNRRAIPAILRALEEEGRDDN